MKKNLMIAGLVLTTVTSTGALVYFLNEMQKGFDEAWGW